MKDNRNSMKEAVEKYSPKKENKWGKRPKECKCHDCMDSFPESNPALCFCPICSLKNACEAQQFCSRSHYRTTKKEAGK